MSLIKEFREFAVKGNVVDMAIGIIIGGSFGKIVSSLVADIIMPPVGLLLGGVDFSEFKLTLKAAQPGAAAVTLNYGQFVNLVLDFLIVAFSMFLAIKAMNSLRRTEPPPAASAPSPTETLLQEIRDLLKTKNQ